MHEVASVALAAWSLLRLPPLHDEGTHLGPLRLPEPDSKLRLPPLHQGGAHRQGSLRRLGIDTGMGCHRPRRRGLTQGRGRPLGPAGRRAAPDLGQPPDPSLQVLTAHGRGLRRVRQPHHGRPGLRDGAADRQIEPEPPGPRLRGLRTGERTSPAQRPGSIIDSPTGDRRGSLH